MSRYSNTCAVLHGPGDLRIESHDIAPPQAGEVQIRIEQTGLCGSDLHYYLHGRNGDFALQEPMCLGHESAGEVVAVGPASSTSSEPSATSTPAPLGVLKAGTTSVPGYDSQALQKPFLIYTELCKR
ncbi:zinc-dependent alcohol [Ceraceosorus bombacis]|uniref:Zinc-dependent alcohol n=1 Tax=Ceraceosorus bombacis TaxID=401625 RepID=A0A0P1BAW5_9BASI|nr:zinc-dependent alcohol [Ceraceosorus bombacis]